jgi:hypothetical protein
MTDPVPSVRGFPEIWARGDAAISRPRTRHPPFAGQRRDLVQGSRPGRPRGAKPAHPGARTCWYCYTPCGSGGVVAPSVYIQTPPTPPTGPGHSSRPRSGVAKPTHPENAPHNPRCTHLAAETVADAISAPPGARTGRYCYTPHRCDELTAPVVYIQAAPHRARRLLWTVRRARSETRERQ